MTVCHLCLIVPVSGYFCQKKEKKSQKNAQVIFGVRILLVFMCLDACPCFQQWFIATVCLYVSCLWAPNIILAFICSAMSDTMIMDAIASYLVLPNRLTVPLVADLHVAQLRSPLPRVNVSIISGPLEKHGPTQSEAHQSFHISSERTHSLHSRSTSSHCEWTDCTKCTNILWWRSSTFIFLLHAFFFLVRELYVSTCSRLRTWPPRIRW